MQSHSSMASTSLYLSFVSSLSVKAITNNFRPQVGAPNTICSSCAWPGRFAADARYKASKGVSVVNARAEIHPGQATQKTRQRLFVFRIGSGQENRDDAQRFVANAFIQRRPHLFIFPRPQSLRAKKDRAG